MHLPLLTLMEQFNAIPEGSDAAGKAGWRKATQLRCQAPGAGVGEAARGRPLRAWAEPGKGDGGR